MLYKIMLETNGEPPEILQTRVEEDYLDDEFYSEVENIVCDVDEVKITKDEEKKEWKFAFDDDEYVIFGVLIGESGDKAIHRLLNEENLTFEEMNRLRKIARDDEGGKWYDSTC